MLIESCKPNQEEYTSQSMSNRTYCLHRTRTQPVIQSNHVFNEVIVRKRSMLSEIRKDKSNQIRTTLLLIIDSERATAMSSKCKINSKSFAEILNELDSYEITIENPLERGTPTLFNAKQSHTHRTELKLKQNEVNNRTTSNDEDQSIDEYSRFFNKLKKKRTISRRKFKKFVDLDPILRKTDSFDSSERTDGTNGVTSSKKSNSKNESIKTGYKYLRELSLLYKGLNTKKRKVTFYSEQNLKNYNSDLSDNGSSDTKVSNNKNVNRANSLIILGKEDKNLIGNNSIANQSKFTNGKQTQQTFSRITPSTKRINKVIKTSSFNYNSNTSSPNKLKNSEVKKIPKEKLCSGSVVILFNGEEIEVDDDNEINPKIIDLGLSLIYT